MSTPEARLVVVDDEPNIRELLATSLRFAGFEVHAAADGQSALKLVRDVDPDLVVLDVMLPDMDGFTVTRRLREWSRTPVIVLSARGQEGDKIQALDAGAAGYITKSSSPEVLLEAVRRILAGHLYIEQPLATQLACRQSEDPRLRGITQREFEIFVMLARGLPAREIAERLCISGKTVSNYLTLLKSKLQVESQAELVHLAIDTGVLRVAAV